MRTLLESQLVEHYAMIRLAEERFFKLQTLCTTIWLATIVLPITGQVAITDDQQIIFSLLPVMFFWLMGSMHNALSQLITFRASQLEHFLRQDDLDLTKVDHLFLAGGGKCVPFKLKISTLLVAMFLSETVIFFYGALFVATFVIHRFLDV